MKKIYLYPIITVIALILLNGCITNAASFSDVSENHMNSDAIEYVKDKNIVAGYPDGNFMPDQTINRAEFIKIIIGAQFSSAVIDNCITKNVQAGANTVFFPDVSKNEWFAKYICVAKMNNVISGYPDGTFKPGNTINFAEAAKIISNAFGYSVTEGGTWYKPFIDNLGEKNAIPDTIKSFNHNITRGEMAEMVYRLKANITTKESLDYEAIQQMGQTMTLNVSFATLKNNANMLDCGKTDTVTKTIPYTVAPARAAMDQLFLGPTTAEKAVGLLDFWITKDTANNLKRVFIKNGTAYLDWKDISQVIPNASTSCGSASFFGPIEDTLRQFPTVTKVIHAINGQTSVFYNWMQMGCSAENNNCDDTPYKATSLPPTSCIDAAEGMPVITSLSVNSGSVGTKLKIYGCNFAGFEGDLNAWIENSQGVKGIFYGASGSTSKLLSVTLDSALCQTDISYSGLPCDAKLSLAPGTYQIYTMPWGKLSNKVDFIVK